MSFGEFLRELELANNTNKNIIEETKKTKKYLSYKIGNDIYSIGVDNLEKIIPLTNIIESPDAPKHIRGIIPYKKGFINVIDLRRLLRSEETFKFKTTVVIKQFNDGLVGLIVDDVIKISKEKKNYLDLTNILKID